MALSSFRLCAMLEISVMLFQVVGVIALCVSRLLPPTSTRWANRGRAGYVVAMIGLGLAGAFCGRHDSDFALFAGGSMTILLIGMTIGSGQVDPAVPPRSLVSAEPNLAS
jgi:hypothetical protein